MAHSDRRYEVSKRRKTSDRVRGLLVMLPWLVERGRANIDEMAKTFGLDRATLVSDLTMATFCGTPPYSPLELIEIYFSDDEVWVEVPRVFTRPFRLTVEEAFALKAIGGAALAVSGADTSSALASALAKLPALGEEDAVVVRQPNDPNVDVLTQACIMRELLKIKYFRPQIRLKTSRQIVPMRVWVDGDHWYVDAFDVSKKELRVFRTDRIQDIKPTGRIVEAADLPQLPGEPGFRWSSDTEDVTVHLCPGAHWIAERYPHRGVKKLSDDVLEVKLPVATPEWLGRLLVRAGSEATVVGSPRHAALGAHTAASILARYAE